MEIVVLLNHESSTQNKPFKWTICLDQTKLSESPLGQTCFESTEPIKPIFASRASRFRFNVKHWNCILVTNEGFIRLEYGRNGIVVKYLSRSKYSIEQVFTGLVGVSKAIFFDDRTYSERQLGEVLRKVDEMSQKYRTDTFSSLSNNCRHFVTELGQFLDPTFNISYNLINFVHDASLQLIGVDADLGLPKKMVIHSSRYVFAKSGLDKRVFLVIAVLSFNMSVLIYFLSRWIRRRRLASQSG